MPETRITHVCPKCMRHLDGRVLLSQPALNTAVHALRVAADRFAEDAKTAKSAGHPRLAEQFERQAAESRELADELE